MSEYRHIGSLRGPRGADATEIPAASPLNEDFIYEDTDWDQIGPGFYRLNHADVSETIGLPVRRLGSVEVLRTSNGTRVARFTTTSTDTLPLMVLQRGGTSTSWNQEWEQIYPAAPGAMSEASEKIKSLAARDGWLGVYDPTDPTTRSTDDQGHVITLSDGLGNLQTLNNNAFGIPPSLSPGEFGQLDALRGGVLNNFYGQSIEQPYTCIVLLKSDDEAPSGATYPIAGATTGGRPSFSVNSSSRYGGQWNANGGLLNRVSAPHTTKPTLIRGTFDATGYGKFELNGETQSFTQGSNAATGLTMGGLPPGDDLFEGAVGAFLIYEGEVSEDKVRRMSALLHSLSGIPKAAPSYPAETIAYTVAESGREMLSHGNVDYIDPDITIASISKVMTLLVARKFLSDEDMDTLVEVDAEDIRDSDVPFEAGDQISYMDLFYATAMVSDNSSPNIIARRVGELILDGAEGDPRERFIEEMNATAQDAGYTGAEYINPQFGARLSARQVIDNFKTSMSDPVLKEAHNVGVRTVQLAKSSGAIEPVELDADSPSWRIPHPQVTARKGGSNYGYNHVVVQWESPQGVVHYTVVLNSPAPTIDVERLVNKTIDWATS